MQEFTSKHQHIKKDNPNEYKILPLSKVFQRLLVSKIY